MQVVPSPSFTHIMTTSSTAPAPPTDGPALSSGIIRLKAGPVRKLPEIDQGSALIADPNVAVPQEIVAGLIQPRLTTVLLASGSKAGKTWFLLALAMCISSGTRFLKWGTTIGKGPLY